MSDAKPQLATDRRSSRRFARPAPRRTAGTGATLLVPAVPSQKRTVPAPVLPAARQVDTAPEPAGITVHAGTDAADAAVVSWTCAAGVVKPRLRLERAGAGFSHLYDAAERTVTDEATGAQTWHYRVELDGLRPDTAYTFEVFHRGAAGVSGTFATSASGAAADADGLVVDVI